jgi:signal transduction histidine kinase
MPGVAVNGTAGWRDRLADAGAVALLGTLAALPDPSFWMGLLLAVVAVAVGLGRANWQRGALALLLCAALVTMGAAAGEMTRHQASRHLVLVLAGAGMPWLMGAAWRLRAQVRHQAADRVAEMRHQRDLKLRQERDAERLTLAQNLHDDLGHALSLVALNLGRLELDPDLGAAARESVATARNQLSEAVARLGSSVASLRDGAPLGLPARDDAEELLERTRRAGAEIHVADWPSPDRLADFDGPTLVHVLHEALTNAVKHAPHHPITIELSDRGDLLRLESRNSTRKLSDQPAAAPASGGTGLASLRRHLQTIGGGLQVASNEDPFTLYADIPRTDAAAANPEPRANRDRPASGLHDTSEDALLAGAQRRGQMILALAVVVVIGAIGVVQLYGVVEARRALLTPDAFARIEVGDPRAEVEKLLPDGELSPRHPSEPGTDCHDYAPTANPFDDASGDAYRICFAGNEVDSTWLIPGAER